MMRLLLWLALLNLFSIPGYAHQFAPALLELQESNGDQVGVRWKEPLIRVLGSQLQPVLPVDCEALDTPTVSEENTGRVSKWTLYCPGGLVGKKLEVANIASSGANVLLRVRFLDGHVLRQILSPAEPGITIPDIEDRWAVFWNYAKLGIEHIMTGTDHLLFVLGLTLLVSGKRLLVTVTAFTVGHSITLALAALGWIHVSTTAIEAGIALSIYMLAVELAGRDRRGFLCRYPWGMAGVFGLLHGLGFAGALSQVGLPDGEIPLALFAFNIGIECGQVAFITVVLLLWGGLRRMPYRWPEYIRLIPAYSIGSLSVFWFFQRI